MNRKNIIAIFCTAILLVIILYKINLGVLITTLKTFNYKVIPITAILYILSLYLRGVRWKILLPDNGKYPSIKLAEIFTVGSMLNIYIPARAGDFYRAYYLGNTFNEKKVKILASIVLERIFDGIAVFLILLSAVLAYYQKPWIIKLTLLTGILFLSSLVFAYLIFKYNKIDSIFAAIINFADRYTKKISNGLTKLKTYLSSFVDGFEPLSKKGTVILSLLLSLIIWAIECIIAYYILIGFNLNLSVFACLFIISLTSFSTMIPSTSVFLGPYQYAYILALYIFGISKSSSLAIA